MQHARTTGNKKRCRKQHTAPPALLLHLAEAVDVERQPHGHDEPVDVLHQPLERIDLQKVQKQRVPLSNRYMLTGFGPKKHVYRWYAFPKRHSINGGQTTASETAALHKPKHPSTGHAVTLRLGLGIGF